MGQENTEQKTTNVNSSDGGQPAAITIVERAEQARKGLEEVEKRLDEKIKTLQDLEVRRTMGGKTNNLPSEAPKELTAAEYAKEIAAGRIPKKQ